MISITLRWLNDVRIFYPNSYKKTRRNPYKKRKEWMQQKQKKTTLKENKRKVKGLEKSRFNIFLENIKHFQVAF